MGSRLSTDQWKVVLDNMRDNRNRYYARLAADYKDESKVLLKAYRQRLKAIDAQIEAVVKAAENGGNVPAALQTMREETIRELGRMETAIKQSARRLQDKAGVIGGQSGGAALEAFGSGFNIPSPQMLKALINYVDSPAFQEAADSFGDYFGKLVHREMVAGMNAGKNPRAIARAILRQWSGPDAPPLHAIQNMTRTVQLWSSRRGTQAVYQQSGIEKWIWSSAADARTCPACWAKHGSIHPVTEVLNDHHQGRCAMTPLTKKWSDILGVEGYDTPDPVSGEVLFKKLTEAEQRAIMGPGRYQAWQAGTFQFSDIPTTYENPVYGTMTRAKTLAELTRS